VVIGYEMWPSINCFGYETRGLLNCEGREESARERIVGFENPGNCVDN